MNKYLLIVFIFIGVNVYAEEATFNFTPPTECENGDVIGETEQCPNLEEYRLQCSETESFPYEMDFLYPIPEENKIIQDFEPGDYWCVLSVRNANEFSRWSNEVNFTIAAPPSRPNPPVLSVSFGG